MNGLAPLINTRPSLSLLIKQLILDTRNLGLLISFYVLKSNICIGKVMFATPTLVRSCSSPPLLMRIVPLNLTRNSPQLFVSYPGLHSLDPGLTATFPLFLSLLKAVFCLHHPPTDTTTPYLPSAPWPSPSNAQLPTVVCLVSSYAHS